jgi:hypothetical protein
MTEEGQRGAGVSGGQTHLARLQHNRNHMKLVENGPMIQHTETI